MSGLSPSWTDFVDALLQRAVLLTRVGAALEADTPHTAVDRLVADLPGFEDDADPAVRQRILADTASQIDDTLAYFESRTYGQEPLARIVTGSRLDQAEAEVLGILAAVDMDRRRQRLVAYLNEDAASCWPTLQTLSQLAPKESGSGWVEAAGPAGGLQRAGLIGVEPGYPFSTAPLKLHPSVLWCLLGDRTPDPDLPPRCEWDPVAGRGDRRLVVAAGSDAHRRRQAIIDSTAGSGGFLVTTVPQTREQWRAVIRSASCHSLGVILEAADDLPGSAADWIERTHHLAWAISSQQEQPLAALPRHGWTQLSVGDATATDTEVHSVFDGDVAIGAVLTAGNLAAIGTAARAMDGDVHAAVRRLAAGGIDRLADRIVPSRGWDDLVLADHQLALMREIVSRCVHSVRVAREWGLPGGPPGVLAMFAGPSGTGKTLAAEVLAGELGVDLYRVDLSRIVDKYIGETEKNLAKIFDSAQASPMVLFFDEADALLAKRTEVSDSHDRHANAQVAFLLQRLERHRGVVVLASNLASNIDQAFMRRIHVPIQFTLPEAPERLRIWTRSVPAQLRSSRIDFEMLATHLEISGAQIRNIAVRAAFLALESGSVLGMDVITRSARRELHQAGRLFPSDRLPVTGID